MSERAKAREARRRSARQSQKPLAASPGQPGRTRHAS
jgi:hypothetical protein